MRADLHLHTLYSDGSFPPAEIARRAHAAGVELFALTDHDSLAGNAEGAQAAKSLGLHYVRGIEVSAYLGATKVHVLGYGCEEGEAYREFLRARVEGARVRAEDILRKANAYFSLDVTLDDAEAYHVAGTPIHTMHLVKAYAKRLGADMGALYRSVFAPAKPAFSDMCRPTPKDAVRIVHAMGGRAVIAHPVQILVLPPDVSARFHLYGEAEKEEAKRVYAPARNALMEELVEEGADGIECYHSTHTAEETEEFLAFAKAHGLFATGGSDFHADGANRRVGSPAFDASHIAEVLLSLKGSV